MKIHLLSDLHIEFAGFEIPATDAEVIVLAGDIGVGLGGLEWLHKLKIQKPVIYVPGNHEFYGHDISLIDELQKQAAPNVHVLNNQSVIIEGVRFLGSTLWTDFDFFRDMDKTLVTEHASANTADFSAIHCGDKLFTPMDAMALHQQSREWLEQELKQGFQGRTVVVSHHAPSPSSVHPRFAQDLLTPAFVSDLENLMGVQHASLWLHGHMHDTFDYHINGTRVVCNPRGYLPYEADNGFLPDLLLDV